MKYFLLIVTAAIVLISSASAASWSGSVKTDSDSWSITRESSNLSFIYEQSVQGRIAPVSYRDRNLSPYHSNYEEMELNDVRVRERTAALEGDFNSEEALTFCSSINNSVNASISKPAGTDLYTIDFYERWPVKLTHSKSMSYRGRQINNREYVGNNGDFIGANFLYNHEFSKERGLNMSLERMNATIIATDEAIDFGEIKATRDTHYKINSHSTGIAGFKWRQIDADDEMLNAGDERFVGVYDIAKNIRMKSRFDTIRKDDDWLPCCSGGFAGMNVLDQRGLGVSTKGVFDCGCFKPAAKAQFRR